MNRCVECRWFCICQKKAYTQIDCHTFEEEKEDISESKSELKRISIMKDLDLE